MFIDNLPQILIKYLLLTILIEILVALLIGVRNKVDIINIIIVNIITNPLLNAIQINIKYYFGIHMRNIALLILEILAILFEGVIYYRFLKCKKMNGFLISFILNLASYGIIAFLG